MVLHQTGLHPMVLHLTGLHPMVLHLTGLDRRWPVAARGGRWRAI